MFSYDLSQKKFSKFQNSYLELAGLKSSKPAIVKSQKINERSNFLFVLAKSGDFAIIFLILT